jgi:outer membrane protein TolC
MAVDHNSRLAIASTQFLAAKGRVIKLHAILYPTLNAQAISTPLTFYVQLQQTFYNHATFPQLRLSRLSEEEVFINYNQVLNDVVFQVRQAFTMALGARRQADLLREYADRQAEAVTSSGQLFEAGKIQKSVVAGIQVKSNLARQHRDGAELAYTQARLALDHLLGEELPETAGLVGDFVKDAPAKLDVEELTAAALRDRPDLKLLESLQLSGEQQIEIDMRNAYPVAGFSSNAAIQPPAFGPTGSFDLERNYNEPALQRQAGNTQLPLSLYATWRIFDGGNLEGVKISDRAKIASRDVALMELKQLIPGEIAAAVAALLNERETLQVLNAQTSPEELRHSAELDYEAGRVRQLDKVNLEDSILQQEQLRLGSEIRLSLAAAALDHALGRGLESK